MRRRVRRLDRQRAIWYGKSSAGTDTYPDGDADPHSHSQPQRVAHGDADPYPRTVADPLPDVLASRQARTHAQPDANAKPDAFAGAIAASRRRLYGGRSTGQPLPEPGHHGRNPREHRGGDRSGL